MGEFNEKVAAMIGKKPADEELVAITKSHYRQLIDDQYKLECLEAAGVDNWQGFDDAMEMYHEGDE
ncbi:hypothetical protein [Bacillus sp. 7894-2]|uniref:hypothetical protein n=1 Tax=Bacillus sp. 7894-2 TaxID=2021695 RepID=UPI000BA70DC6|nr:hypothetical protein [Bacillus sp. 7894-2]PAE24040.1 hypothetical protein CHI10_14645 [Bacillus sp. 7894-2]